MGTNGHEHAELEESKSSEPVGKVSGPKYVVIHEGGADDGPFTLHTKSGKGYHRNLHRDDGDVSWILISSGSLTE